jgi:hypothetical protein
MENSLSDLPSLNRKKPSNSMQVLLSLPISRFTGHAHTGLYGNGFIKQRWLHPPLVREYQQIYGGNEIIQKSSFVNRIHNYLIINYFHISSQICIKRSPLGQRKSGLI